MFTTSQSATCVVLGKVGSRYGVAVPRLRMQQNHEFADADAQRIDSVEQLKGHGFEIVWYCQDRGRFDALRQLEEVPGLAGKLSGLKGIVGFG